MSLATSSNNSRWMNYLHKAYPALSNIKVEQLLIRLDDLRRSLIQKQEDLATYELLGSVMRRLLETDEAVSIVARLDPFPSHEFPADGNNKELSTEEIVLEDLLDDVIGELELEQLLHKYRQHYREE